MGLCRSPVHMFGVAAASAASVGVGLLLVFKLITPESVSRLDTHELLGLLGLLVLPVLTLAAMRHVRRIQPPAPRPISAPDDARATSTQVIHPRAHGSAHTLALLQPEAAERKADRHRRRQTGQRAL